MSSANYRLPNAQTLRVSGYSNITIPSGSNSGVSNITPANLCQEFNTGSPGTGYPRVVDFKSAQFEMLPILNAADDASAGQGYFAQAFGLGLSGTYVPLTKVIPLSLVNPTKFNVRKPLWLEGPLNVDSTQPWIVLQVTATYNVGTPNAVTIPFNVSALGDISPSVPNRF